jgi:hypothetical protein
VQFEPLLTQPTWRKARRLRVGTRLVRGRRTVSAALRIMGHAADPPDSRFHQVLNRARRAPLVRRQRLCLLVVRTVVPADALVSVVLDEHLERRWGPWFLSGKSFVTARHGAVGCAICRFVAARSPQAGVPVGGPSGAKGMVK